MMRKTPSRPLAIAFFLSPYNLFRTYERNCAAISCHIPSDRVATQGRSSRYRLWCCLRSDISHRATRLSLHIMPRYIRLSSALYHSGSTSLPTCPFRHLHSENTHRRSPPSCCYGTKQAIMTLLCQLLISIC